MAGRNIHKEPFDDGTLLKLDIFHKYLKEWLPVFLNQKGTRIDWVLDLQEQCEKAEVAFFFKQWGRYKQKKERKNVGRKNMGRDAFINIGC
jgi:hypothetical protein